ncbi:MAG: hypothetical protein HQL15_01370 [Candidatus Omnitrophica bacterium]|nr:hypothetical protein [Candidatus Omnitrophota bacterium]
MNKTAKSFIAVLVTAAFFASAVLCCCVVKDALASQQKASCSHCSSNAKGSASSHECCFSKAAPMELAKNAGLLHLLPLVSFTLVCLLYIRPRPRFVLKSIYSNGPPGYVSTVPLYIQARSLRI